jgi:hypothetical protein
MRIEQADPAGRKLAAETQVLVTLREDLDAKEK